MNKLQLIGAIADRGIELLKTINVKAEKIDIYMDIDFTDKVCPLKLDEFLNATNFNFNHEFMGIYANLNRETKQLDNCFLRHSRYAIKNR